MAQGKDESSSAFFHRTRPAFLDWKPPTDEEKALAMRARSDATEAEFKRVTELAKSRGPQIRTDKKALISLPPNLGCYSSSPRRPVLGAAHLNLEKHSRLGIDARYRARQILRQPALESLAVDEQAFHAGCPPLPLIQAPTA